MVNSRGRRAAGRRGQAAARAGRAAAPGARRSQAYRAWSDRATPDRLEAGALAGRWPERCRDMGRERLARYSLAGAENRAAVEAGLAGGDWFRSDVPRKRMKELMRRSDYPAIRDTAIWIGLILLFAGLGIALWGTWWAWPCFFVYGTLYGSTSDSRWHETGHGTAFKTRWLDEGLYQLASFMIMRDPTVWRWSHARHHTDTLILGRDPEIAAMRPARLVAAAGELRRPGRRVHRVPADVPARFRPGSPRTRLTSSPSRSGTRSTGPPGSTWPSTRPRSPRRSRSGPGCRSC